MPRPRRKDGLNPQSRTARRLRGRVAVEVSLSPEAVRMIDEAAKDWGVSRSQVIEDVITFKRGWH